MTYPSRLRTEKAHLEVFDILLQILNEGRLTDRHGRTVDFKNTIIIMTSNLGSAYIQEIEDEEEIRGYDPMLGAQPLKRALQRLMQNPLARRIQEGAFGEGDAVTVDVEGGEVAFTKADA